MESYRFFWFQRERVHGWSPWELCTPTNPVLGTKIRELVKKFLLGQKGEFFKVEMFELYATGEYSLHRLKKELADLGHSVEC